MFCSRDMTSDGGVLHMQGNCTQTTCYRHEPICDSALALPPPHMSRAACLRFDIPRGQLSTGGLHDAADGDP